MRRPTPFRWQDGAVILDPDVIEAFTSIGITEEIFREWIAGQYPEESLVYTIMAARAYDNEHGTETCENFPPISNLPDFPCDPEDFARIWDRG